MPFHRHDRALRGQERGCQAKPLEATKLCLLMELVCEAKKVYWMGMHGDKDRRIEIPTRLILIPQT